VNHKPIVDYRRFRPAEKRCTATENADRTVTVDIAHRELSGCVACGSVRFITRNVVDPELRMSTATVCALCGVVDNVHIVDGLPLELPTVAQTGIYDDLVDDLGVDPDAPVEFWPAAPVAVAGV
jgi:hypothetical protein